MNVFVLLNLKRSLARRDTSLEQAELKLLAVVSFSSSGIPRCFVFEFPGALFSIVCVADSRKREKVRGIWFTRDARRVTRTREGSEGDGKGSTLPP